MLFTLKSCRPFTALVVLFLLVVQVVAVPPKAKKRPSRPTQYRPIVTGTLIINAHKKAHNAHVQAKEAHTKVHDLHHGLALKHELFVAHVHPGHGDIYHKAAHAHREIAQKHLDTANAHHTAAEHHRNPGHLASSELRAVHKSTKEAKGSLKNAQLLHRHAELLGSAMTAAEEHRIAHENHQNAAKLAHDLGDEPTAKFHSSQQNQHHFLTFYNSGFAALNTHTKNDLKDVDKAIKVTEHSASKARLSNEAAHASIQQTVAALPHSYWHAYAQ